MATTTTTIVIAARPLLLWHTADSEDSIQANPLGGQGSSPRAYLLPKKLLFKDGRRIALATHSRE